ncbi:excinuclease ABC subunit B [Candidatus Peregrinibacteria bacterium CG_4_10_14_0_2_um_filter_41_8]|nr:MAG: excinuclease ABC subunit B [Candidatus Peregrinibacteria bacterium CG_4_10_14_0_2_um_filter_41_8]
MDKFVLHSSYQPQGDQPKAIEKLVKGVNSNQKFQTLLGVTGSGKTFTLANLVAQVQKPTLVLAHNKTLAAQLCSEFQEFFPDNAVSYFVSYYDYYQPEAYMPSSDTYIEKDASINEEINKFRHAATVNLLTRKDVLIVASVSCIYGLGPVEDYAALAMELSVGEERKRDKLLRQLTDIQYTRSQLEFKQGMFHVLGDVLEIFPPSQDTVYRLEFFGDEIEKITEVDGFTGELVQELDKVMIFPAKHNVTTKEKVDKAIAGIRADLEIRVQELEKSGRMLEAARIRQRTEYDLEILQEVGYCSGIENYTRYFSTREDGAQPATLMDYFPDDFLMIVDESHITIPQIGGMHAGNHSRKQTLIEYGFRLPSSHDNRPLKFEEFERHLDKTILVSATPGKYDYEKTDKKNIVEQVIRPTGLVDPIVEIQETKGQIDDLIKRLNVVIKNGHRGLITTLTKNSAEKLTEFLVEANFKVKYLHSDIDTLERIDILRDLRLGVIDVIVGINLLREGLDLPEVAFIGILDADKQGFLRSTTALIQTIGRAARNVEGYVVMYADKITDAMAAALSETERRRNIQIAHNLKHGITPQSIVKAVKDIAQHRSTKLKGGKKSDATKVPKEERLRLLAEMEAQMDLASQNFEFEKAAELRDEIERLQAEWGL